MAASTCSAVKEYLRKNTNESATKMAGSTEKPITIALRALSLWVIVPLVEEA